jgi:hypothetical protein
MINSLITIIIFLLGPTYVIDKWVLKHLHVNFLCIMSLIGRVIMTRLF